MIKIHFDSPAKVDWQRESRGVLGFGCQKPCQKMSFVNLRKRIGVNDFCTMEMRLKNRGSLC